MVLDLQKYGNISRSYNWTRSLLRNPLFSTTMVACPGLVESKLTLLFLIIVNKALLYLFCLTPFFQIFGIFGCLWSLAIVMLSKRINFIKTKYFYCGIFLADIIAILFMTGLEKSLNFIANFDPAFIQLTINHSVILCQITTYVLIVEMDFVFY